MSRDLVQSWESHADSGVDLREGDNEEEMFEIVQYGMEALHLALKNEALSFGMF